MIHYIHLNLIKDDEIVSASPVRIKTFVPILLLALSLYTVVWGLYLLAISPAIKSLNKQHEEIGRELKKSYTETLLLKKEQKLLQATVDHISAFERSKLNYGATLARIPDHVQSNIQFTVLQVPPPPTPLFDKDNPQRGPTNTTEEVHILISGKTAGEQAFPAVNALLKMLNSNAHTNLILNAYIPEGSFRQASRSSQTDNELLQFQIFCDCGPRRFQ